MRSLFRGLNILRALNEQGPSTVVELARATQISRPSIYRSLEALCEAGYVRRRVGGERFELAHMVRTLSDGFDEEAWLREIASPVLADLQKEIVWPTDLATLVNNAMYLRETTRWQSPLTIDRASIGLRLPMLQSATGRAYLAFCNDNERKVFLSNLRRSKTPEDVCAKDSRWVNSILEETRRNGYGHRYMEWRPETGSIAIPMFSKNRILACLNITFIASAMRPEEAARRYLGAMKTSVEKIEKALATSITSH
jgi:IclR family mhp operon transcriptional activator